MVAQEEREKEKTKQKSYYFFSPSLGSHALSFLLHSVHWGMHKVLSRFKKRGYRLQELLMEKWQSLEKHVGTKILLQPFLSNAICHITLIPKVHRGNTCNQDKIVLKDHFWIFNKWTNLSYPQIFIIQHRWGDLEWRIFWEAFTNHSP